MKKAAQESPSFLHDGHDHARCLHTALDTAAAVCAQRGVRFTQLRERVLEIVWQSHKPLGAYNILQRLARDGRTCAPPTVYRALGFLLEHGLVHRVTSLNAFMGCASPGHRGEGQLLICRVCGSAAELTDQRVDTAIRKSASDHGFEPSQHSVEISGLCPNCVSA